MKPALVTLLLSGAAVAGYVAYRLVGPATFDAAEPPATAATEESPRTLADRLPEITLENLDGQQQAISSFAGKPLVINFWATWCAPCRREIPMLKAFQDENPWLTVVGIAVDDRDAVVEYAAETKFNYPILRGEADAMLAAGSFGVEFFALPFTIFVDGEGRTLGVHTGELHGEHLDELTAVLEDLGGGRADLATARARIAGEM